MHHSVKDEENVKSFEHFSSLQLNEGMCQTEIENSDLSANHTQYNSSKKYGKSRGMTRRERVANKRAHYNFNEVNGVRFVIILPLDCSPILRIKGQNRVKKVKGEKPDNSFRVHLQKQFKEVVHKYRRRLKHVNQLMQKRSETFRDKKEALCLLMNNDLLERMKCPLSELNDDDNASEMQFDDTNVVMLASLVDDTIAYLERPLTLYVRRSGLSKELLLKVYNDTELTKVKSIYDLSKLSVLERKSYLCSCLGLNTVDYLCIPNELQVFVIAIHYWFQNTSFKPTKVNVYVLILCVIMFYYIGGTLDNFKDTKHLESLLQKSNPSGGYSRRGVSSENANGIFKQIDLYSCAFAAKNMAKYHEFSQIHKIRTFNIHLLSEFKVCYHYVDALNSFIGSPFSNIAFDSIINGDFYNNMFIELSNCKDRTKFLTAILGDRLQMTAIFDYFHEICCDLLSINSSVNLFPKIKSIVEDNGRKKILFKENYRQKKQLMKSKEKYDKQKEEIEVDILVKEFENMDINKKKVCKRPK